MNLSYSFSFLVGAFSSPWELSTAHVYCNVFCTSCSVGCDDMGQQRKLGGTSSWFRSCIMLCVLSYSMAFALTKISFRKDNEPWLPLVRFLLFILICANAQASTCMEAHRHFQSFISDSMSRVFFCPFSNTFYSRSFWDKTARSSTLSKPIISQRTPLWLTAWFCRVDLEQKCTDLKFSGAEKG